MTSTLSEVVFRTTYEDPIINLSKRFPSFKLYTWCNRCSDVLEIVVENPKEYPLAMEQLGPPPKGAYIKFFAESRVHIIKKDCSCLNSPNSDFSIIKQIDDLALLYISPGLTQRGWIYHRIIAFRDDDIRKLMCRLERTGMSVEVTHRATMNDAIGDLMLLHADTLFSDITEKQMNALLTAYRHGYYNLPRRTDIRTIAKKKSVPATTFHEHLKKAENKLVKGLIPYIQLYAPKSAQTNKKPRVGKG